MTMRFLFTVISVVLFGIAIYFGNQQPMFQVTGPSAIIGNQSMEAHVAVTPNLLAGLAALGFALAGGLSLIAAAIVKGKGELANKP